MGGECPVISALEPVDLLFLLCSKKFPTEILLPGEKLVVIAKVSLFGRTVSVCGD
jgi:hypothetical protein